MSLLLLQKFRRLNIHQISRLLRPQVVNQLLYEHTRHSLDEALNQSMNDSQKVFGSNINPLQEALEIKHFTKELPSGKKDLDKRLNDDRECYAVAVNGEIAHESWLFHSVLLPSQFGFLKQVPVIGDCVTRPDFRGRHLYPRVLMHVADDIIRHDRSSSVYVLVSPDNKASIRGIERAGFQLIAHLKGLRVAGFLVKKA